MRNLMGCTAALLAATGLSGGLLADTSEVTWHSPVVIAKQGAHCADDPNCFNRYHPAIKPVARAKPGDLHRVRDARCARLRPHGELGRRGPRRGRPQPGPSDHRSGGHRGRRARRRAGGDPGRHRARSVRLHGDRAGLRLPARPLPRSVHRQLEARPAGGDLRRDARRARADRGLHGLGRRAARRYRGRYLGRARKRAGRGRRLRAAAAAHRRPAGGRLRPERQPQG